MKVLINLFNLFRHRLINASPKFIMLHDNRLFQKNLYYIWKKFIDVVFIEKTQNTELYKITSVPFPVQHQSIVPLQINSWYRGKFQVIISIID